MEHMDAATHVPGLHNPCDAEKLDGHGIKRHRLSPLHREPGRKSSLVFFANDADNAAANGAALLHRSSGHCARFKPAHLTGIRLLPSPSVDSEAKQISNEPSADGCLWRT